jgi:hypothetical protein
LTGFLGGPIFRAMLGATQQKILDALYSLMRQVARVLLRSGIGYREFAEITKTAFVDVATTDYGLRGRPTNISRIAVMTGLTRKEIRRIRAKIEGAEASTVYRTVPASDVLHFWHTDPNFLDENGLPAVLEFDDTGKSFASLVKKYGGDIPPGAMRTELKRVGAIREDEDGHLTVLKRSFSLPTSSEKIAEGLVGLSALAQTIAHNADSLEKGISTYVQRTVETKRVSPGDAKRLRRIASSRLVEFSESMDDVFGAYEALHENEDENPINVIGIGLYYFEGEP